jgi:hypothetical protein
MASPTNFGGSPAAARLIDSKLKIIKDKIVKIVFCIRLSFVFFVTTLGYSGPLLGQRIED